LISLVLPITFFLCFLALYLLAPGNYLRVLSEDGIVEYLQVIVLVTGGVAALLHYKQERHLMFLAWAIACFFVAAEEISWGQRILDIPIPDALKPLNNQWEINLHNLHVVEYFLDAIWVAAGLTLIAGSKVSGKYFPPTYYFLYFLPVVIVYTWYLLLPYLPIPWFSWQHQEAAEFFLYSGLAQWLVVLTFRAPDMGGKSRRGFRPC